jgi:ABC-2 type transport system ATP-binding protein
MLEILNFTKRYGDHTAVDSLNLTVEPGDIYGFIGHNGAGKTTTLRSAAGILDFSEGDIRILGTSIREDPIFCKKQIAYIPDNPDIYEYLTGIRYLNFIADVYEVTRSDRMAAIQKYGDLFELTGNLGNQISSYSHGMKQKLVLIAALLHSPKLLLLDEPFVGLDPLASHQLKELMTELCGRGGAIFFSTHVLDVAEKLCNKIAIIRRGRLVISGSTEQVRGDNSLEEVFLELIDHE